MHLPYMSEFAELLQPTSIVEEHQEQEEFDYICKERTLNSGPQML